MFCCKCGTQLDDSSAFCPKCGSAVATIAGQPATIVGQPPVPEAVSPKSRLAATLLACPFLLAGLFGAHRFYMGKYKSAAGMLVLGLAATACYFGYMGTMMTGFANFENFEEDGFPAGVIVFMGGCSLFGVAAFIWALVDFVIAVTGGFKDREGRPITKW